MNAAGQIQSAIDALTKLRDTATGGHKDLIDRARHAYLDAGGLEDELADALEEESASRAILHATIDAQLTILLHAFGQIKDGMSPDEPGSVEDALDLARAINGQDG